MSGNTSMMLGGFAFEALGFSYQGIKRSLNTSWTEIPVGEVLNPMQWTGPTSDEITIQGVLFTKEFGGQSQLDGIAASAEAGVPMMLVSGDGVEGEIHGTFAVQGIEEDKSYYDPRAVAARNAYSIKLKRMPDGDGAGGVPLTGAALAGRAIDFLDNLFR